jgi:hypothetical protein
MMFRSSVWCGAKMFALVNKFLELKILGHNSIASRVPLKIVKFKLAHPIFLNISKWVRNEKGMGFRGV